MEFISIAPTGEVKIICFENHFYGRFLDILFPDLPLLLKLAYPDK